MDSIDKSYMLNSKSFSNIPDKDSIFTLKLLSLPISQNEILGIGVCNKFLIISNKKNEVFRWIFDQDDSLRTAHSIPLPDKSRGQVTKFYIDNKGNHTIFKHNSYYFYFNIQSQKIKQIHKLNDVSVESVAFDETAGENSTNTILIGTDKGKIYGYQIDYDARTDKVTEKMTELIKLKQEKIIYGLSVSFYINLV